MQLNALAEELITFYAACRAKGLTHQAALALWRLWRQTPEANSAPYSLIYRDLSEPISSVDFGGVKVMGLD